MKPLCYYIYFGEDFKEGLGKVAVHISRVYYGNLPLVAVAPKDEGVDLFFCDVLWARENDFYLGNLKGVSKELKSRLEEILEKKKEKRGIFGEVKKSISDEEKMRRPRRGNYVFCIHELGSKCLDAEYVKPEDIPEWLERIR